MGLGKTVMSKRILVCVGSGGVGKTTTAAAIALQAAVRGRRTLVLTIDPAKRLANSLGLEALGHQIRLVPAQRLKQVGRVKSGGSLSAMMLDQQQAFDEMVSRHASDPDAVKRILANPVYQQISGSLAGSQEYAALVKLHELDHSGDWDLIVVDTPPTAHALDFLDAPRKLTEAIDSPAIEWFRKLRNNKGGWSVIGKTGSYVIKKLSKFVGAQFIDDMSVFFTEFNDILGGFRQRAEEVFDLLRQPRVGFILVASPEEMAVSEALFFHRRLIESEMPISGFVVNRIHRNRVLETDIEQAKQQLIAHPALVHLGLDSSALGSAANALIAAYLEQEQLADSDRLSIERIQAVAAELPVAKVEQQSCDVHQIERLAKLGDALLD